MDFVSVAIAVPALIRQVGDLYERCNCSAEFRHLAQELKAFQEALVLTQKYLLHRADVRKSCEDLAAEIAEVTRKSSSRVWRIANGPAPIQPLMMRLVSQKMTLLIFQNLLKESGLASHVIASAPSSQSLDSAYNYYQQAQRQAALNVPYLLPKKSARSSVSTVSSSDTASETFSTDESASSVTTIDTAIPSSGFNQDKSTISNKIVEVEFGTTVAASAVLMDISKTPYVHVEHAEQVRTLMRRQNASFECKDTEFLRTPLIWAVISGRGDLVDLYLAEGADIDTVDGLSGWTPAHHAVMWQRVDILELLVRKGADIAIADYEGNTALLLAAEYGNYSAAKLLVGPPAKGGNYEEFTRSKSGMTPSALAYSKRFLDIARLCIENGDNPNFEFASGHSLLESAILERNEDFASILLEFGAQADALSIGGVSLLVLAIQLKLQQVAQLLIRKGADVLSTDENDDSALILTIQNKMPAILQLLAVGGADVNCCNRDGIPPLVLAVKDQRHDVVDVLLRQSADIDIMDPDGYTPLLWAIWSNDAVMVKKLVEKGADVGDQNGAVRMWVAQMGNDEIAQVISSHGRKH